jgi:hypothetical protein
LIRAFAILFLVVGLAAAEPGQRDVLVERERSSGGSAVHDRRLPFTRVPEFVLFEDGWCFFLRRVEIRIDERTHVDREFASIKLSAAEADSVRRHVLALGFERIEPYERMDRPFECEDEPFPPSGAQTGILRVRLDDGSLKETRNTWGVTLEQQEALMRIRRFLCSFSDTSAAKTYTGDAGCIVVCEILSPRMGRYGPPSFDPEILRAPAPNVYRWAVPVHGERWRRMLSVFRTNVRGTWVTHNGRSYEVFPTPWMPGFDHTEEARRYRRVLPGG